MSHINEMYSQSISTHTLRGERDLWNGLKHPKIAKFQLTRSVGSVTGTILLPIDNNVISTHTLRGERDGNMQTPHLRTKHFNSHAPWGA